MNPNAHPNSSQNPFVYSVRTATLEDAEMIVALLVESGLSAEGILVEGSRYWVAETAGGQVIGVVGLEYGQGAVLLRSAAVRPVCRGRGVGAALLERAIAEVAAAGIARLYLFSTDAGSYWQRQGFRQVPVPELLSVLPNVYQVQEYQRLGWLPTEVAWRRDCSVPFVT